MRWIAMILALVATAPTLADADERAMLEGRILANIQALAETCRTIDATRTWIAETEAAIAAGETGAGSVAGFSMAQQAGDLDALETRKLRLKGELEALRALLDDLPEPTPGIIGEIDDAAGRAAAEEAELRAILDSLRVFPVPDLVQSAPGIVAIDPAVPVGRGQRELVIGKRDAGQALVPLDAMLDALHRDTPADPEWRLDYAALQDRPAAEVWAALEQVRAQAARCAGLAGKAASACYQAAAGNAQLVAQNARRLDPRDPALVAQSGALRDEINAARQGL